ncbi:MAG: rod shape-determining protein [Bacillota bacterium]|jgi:rod shape-determining protein MreB|nr:rod shape-determining protein [Bacillota bacterium]NLH87960.1 rod shape-determining protein [Bacillota bacterium]HAN86177.1 rod shape-determining protein [Bacillota bacterium]
MACASLFGGLARDMGIDLGTANTLVYVRGKGIVLQEPSVIAIDRDSQEILAVGYDAKKMVGRTPASIVAVRPMRDGVIADLDVTVTMLRHFIEKASKRHGVFKPRVVIGVPSGVTQVERRVIHDSAIQAGAKEAFLIEEPMAAAIGAGLPVEDATGNMVVDVGGGTTEVAVISLGGIVAAKSITIAGDKMDEAIVNYMKRNYNLMIGERTAEEIKKTVGSAYPSQHEETMEARGRDIVNGLPKTVNISNTEIQQALSDPVGEIVNAVRMTLEKTPPELSADVIDKGIVMTGGGSMLQGLDRLLADVTGMPVYLTEDPLTCVARGAGNVVEHLATYRRVLVSSGRLK